MINPADFPGETIEPEICISESTYIVILCLGLLIISIILETIKVKMMRKKAEQIKKEIRTFLILFSISLILLLIFIKEMGFTTIVGIQTFTTNPIWYIMLDIALVINIIIAINPFLYIIKQRRRKND